MKEPYQVMGRLLEHAAHVDKWCKEHGYVRIVTYVIGSWNYNLADDNSDIDTRSLIVPRLETEILHKLFEGTTIYMENGEHCSILDARKGIESYFKQCITATEGLFAKYWTAPTEYMRNFWIPLQEMAEEICHYDARAFTDSTVGYIISMYKRYESAAGTTKNLMHMKRAIDFYWNIMNHESFKDSFYLDFEKRNFLLRIKYEEMPWSNTLMYDNIIKQLKQVSDNRNTYIQWLNESWGWTPEKQQETKEKVNKLLVKLYSLIWSSNS